MELDRRFRAAYALIALVLLAILVATFDAPAKPWNPDGRWLEPLVMIVLAAFLFEPNYSGTGATLANAVAAGFIALSSAFRVYPWWWSALAVGAAVVGTSLISERLLTSPDRSTSSRIASFLRSLGMTIGTWRVLLLASLLLTLISFSPPFTAPWGISAVVVVFTAVILGLAPHRFLTRGSVYDRAVRRAYPPSELLIDFADESGPRLGECLEIYGDQGQARQGVVASRSFLEGRASVRLYVPELFELLRDSTPAELSIRPVAVEVSPALKPLVDALAIPGSHVVGITTEGSRMQQREVEITALTEVTLGELLWSIDGDARTYWQVTDARLLQTAWGGETRRQVVASAVQLGEWVEQRLAFADRPVSPPVSGLVLSGEDVGPHQEAMPAGCVKVGTVPKSRFPVVADLREMSLHHVALLGVTGTGKTHLAFEIINAMAELGTRVVCVDPTGQYRARFPVEMCPELPVNDILDFVAEDGGGIALAQLDPGGFSVLEARQLANKIFAWAKHQPPLGETEPARCVLMFEEAQNYVPEWFVLDNNAHKAAAQETSRIVMEGRKFGLGFMLASQRTAMVTKSALSQCSTIFAFQAVDETSIDYFEGLCGRTLATGLSNLPPRVAVSMGRGLLSSRPLIMRTNDAAVVVQ